jgi:hypothetical protein
MRVGRRQGDLLGDEEGERDMLGDMEIQLAREGAGDGVDLEELSLSRLGVLSKGMRDLDEEECLGLNEELRLFISGTTATGILDGAGLFWAFHPTMGTHSGLADQSLSRTLVRAAPDQSLVE